MGNELWMVRGFSTIRMKCGPSAIHSDDRDTLRESVTYMPCNEKAWHSFPHLNIHMNMNGGFLTLPLPLQAEEKKRGAVQGAVGMKQPVCSQAHKDVCISCRSSAQWEGNWF